VLQQDPSSLSEVLADVTRLGEAAGIEARAGELRAELEGRLGAVRAAVEGAPRPRVVALEWLDPPFVGGHWIPAMVGIAGGLDVAGPPEAKSPEVPWEELAALRPDVVVVMPCGWYVEQSKEQAAEHWGRIENLGAERVFAVDAASTYSRPGPRLVDGVELLAHLFHPDRVEAPGAIGFADLSAQISRS
jgi:iron complex transport system substrate-binding protein